MNNVLEHILNKNKDEILLTGVVSSLIPLQVKLYPGDDAISVKCLGNLLGIKVNSNVLLARFQSKFIVVGIIQDSPYPIGHTEYIIKQNDENRYNTTTVSNDNELTLTLPPNGIYEIESRLFVDAASTNPDIKVRYSTSNVTELQWRNSLGHGTGTTSVYNSNSIHFTPKYINTDANYGMTAAGYASIWEVFIVSTGSNQGTITLQYAQVSATAENITMKANSLIKYTKINNN